MFAWKANLTKLIGDVDDVYVTIYIRKWYSPLKDF